MKLRAFAVILASSPMLFLASGSRMTCTPGTRPCEIDPATRPCLLQLLPIAKLEIQQTTSILRDKFAMLFAKSPHFQVYLDAKNFLDLSVNQSLNIMKETEDAKESEYLVAVTNMYCSISEIFVDNLKSSLLENIRAYNDDITQDVEGVTIDEAVIGAEIDISVQIATEIKEKYFVESTACFQCSTIYPQLAEAINGAGALCKTANFLDISYKTMLTLCRSVFWL